MLVKRVFQQPRLARFSIEEGDAIGFHPLPRKRLGANACVAFIPGVAIQWKAQKESTAKVKKPDMAVGNSVPFCRLQCDALKNLQIGSNTGQLK